jgi:C4-dicarboxylate-specific signal transduction histidine kinase
LAASGDWRAVHLRLLNQIRPLVSLSSTLVEKVQHEVGEQQAQAVLNIGRVQRRVFVIVPMTAVFTLLIAATLGLGITRSITQPLERLVEGSRALARGEFRHQVAITGDDELAHLGQVFNDTARRLAFDIEERQRAEEALRQAQAELAHVGRVTTLGEMAASIAHEVDQPLSGVVINANACMRFLSAATPDLDEVREGLQAIARDGRRASDVIARIRALARRTATEKELLDINEVVGEVVLLADGEARRTRVRLLTELAGDLPRVLGDRVQLQQVVLNLLLNGLDAMHGVAGRPRDLIIRTHAEEHRVRVVVQDSGSGIDPAFAERIFDAFYTTKRRGIGMGLSISRSIVQQHGGRLWAEPNDGPGTTFQFTV